MTKKNKLIVRLKGGLGNQLFCYAAGKRLAHVNSAEFILDHITGFETDIIYKRTYQLHNFNVKAKFASPSQRMEPFKIFRKKALHYIAKKQKFEDRKFIFQEKNPFEERLVNLKFKGTRYLDGYWQSEKYFTDIETELREELTLKNELDVTSNHIFNKISSTNAVSIHFRWFDDLGSNKSNNISIEYYLKAIEHCKSEINDPHFFVFSDNLESVLKVLPLSQNEFTLVNHNTHQDEAYKDLWLMSKCKAIIMANSTFSWWAGWLGEPHMNFVICPGRTINHEGRITSWNFDGHLPDRWIQI